MRIAAIADVHGNSAALEAVLRDVDRVGADAIVNLGDHFSGPLDAAGWRIGKPSSAADGACARR